MVKKSIVLLLAAILLQGSAGIIFARELTLDDCIRMALKKNETVIQAQNQAKLAGETVWQSWGAFLPSLSASGSVNESHTLAQSFIDTGVVFTVTGDNATVPPDTLNVTTFENRVETGGINKSYSVGFNSSWTIFNGGSNLFNLLGSMQDKKYFEYLAESSEQGIIFNVKTLYFAYLNSLERLGISQEAVKRGEEQLKLAQSQYEVGAVPRSDVLKAKVQYGNERLGLIDAENNLRIAEAELKFIIGLDVNSDDTLSTDFEAKEYKGTEGDALKLGLANHPGLIADEYSVKAAKYDIRSTFGRYLPSLSVNFSKGWSNSRWSEVTDFKPEDESWSVSASVSLPIFTNFSRKRDMARAKLGLQNARASLFFTRNQVALDVKEAYLGIERAQEALNVASENVEAAQEDMSLVEEKYNLGAATILELLDAQVSLVTAQNNRAQAEFDYNLAVARLELAMGVR